MNGFSVAIFSILIGSLGQITLKVGANKLGTLFFQAGQIGPDLIRVIKTPEIIIGMVFFGFSSLLWIKVLTLAELSQAYPLVSIGYIIVAVLSYVFFKESFTIPKVLGIGLIIAGVVIINN